MRPRPVDVADDLATFVATLPRWVGPDGYPLSWAHYVVGLRHLRRIRPRAQLDHADAMMAANATKEHREQWLAVTMSQTGWEV